MLVLGAVILVDTLGRSETPDKMIAVKRGLSTTHDVGERLKWEAQAKGAVPNWDHDPSKARSEMQTVCAQCHSRRWGSNYLARHDWAVQYYDKEFYRPAKAIMTGLYKDGILTKWPVFDEEIEWVMYELWHHEGRRGPLVVLDRVPPTQYNHETIICTNAARSKERWPRSMFRTRFALMAGVEPSP